MSFSTTNCKITQAILNTYFHQNSQNKYVLALHTDSLCCWIGKSRKEEKREGSSRPRIYVKCFLSFPQKTCHQRKLIQTKCLLFNLLMIMFTVIPKKTFETWQFGKIGVLSQFSLVTVFFEEMN